MADTVCYAAWLPRMVAFLAWCTLGPLAGEESFASSLRHDLAQAREAWRSFAAGQAATPGRFELHMLPVVSLADSWQQDIYADRAGQMQPLLTRTGEAFAWIKLPGVVCLGSIAGRLPAESRLATAPSVWNAAAQPVPGSIRFVMFEELQRSLQSRQSVFVEAGQDRGRTGGV